MNAGLLCTWTLAVRELVRFFRQRTRVVGALGQPVIFWILFGAGLRGSFKPPAWAQQLSHPMSYQEYFFPGVAVMIVLFTSIFSTISIIEDRREGFLQGVLVSPASRAGIVLGKVAGGTALAVLQAVLFLLFGPALHFVGLAPTMGAEFTVIGGLWMLSFLALIGAGLTGLGYCIAWPMESTQGFHAVMSVFLFPLWLLSGAFFPGGEGGWLSWIIASNPLTYGVAGLRRLMYWGPNELPPGNGLPDMAVCLAVTAGFCVACVGLAVWQTSRPHVRNTR
ncbi:MAG: ABC transporter permease [Planctomycetaceae bacterium]